MSTLANVILRDTTSNRPAAGTPGRLFFATDTSKTWRDNGSSWDDVSDASGLTTVTESNLSFSDNTTANSSSTKHGLLPKLPNDATKFLDGTGAFTVPAGGSSGALVTTMTAAAFNTETTNGAAQGSHGYTVVQLTDGPYQCIWNGSAWEYYMGGYKCGKIYASGLSVINNTNSATLSDANGILTLDSVNAMTYTSAWAKSISNPSACTITAWLEYSQMAWAVDYQGGLFICESSGTKHLTIGPRIPGDLVIGLTKWASFNSTEGAAATLDIPGQRLPTRSCWVRLAIASGTMTLSVSFNGWDFRTLLSEAVGTYITPAKFGLAWRKTGGISPTDRLRCFSLVEA